MSRLTYAIIVKVKAAGKERSLGSKHIRILILDGQGGGIGRELVAGLLPHLTDQMTLTAVGTNAAATAAMLKAGAQVAATGEAAFIYHCAKADFILGPAGVLSAGSLQGEMSAAMAAAVGFSDADKIVVPVGRCSLYIAGLPEQSIPERITAAIHLLRTRLATILEES